MLKTKDLLKTVNSNEKLFYICKRLKMLFDSWMNNKEISNIIQKLELPLPSHLFITWNFSELMKIIYK